MIQDPWILPPKRQRASPPFDIRKPPPPPFPSGRQSFSLVWWEERYWIHRNYAKTLSGELSIHQEQEINFLCCFITILKREIHDLITPYVIFKILIKIWTGGEGWSRTSHWKYEPLLPEFKIFYTTKSFALYLTIIFALFKVMHKIKIMIENRFLVFQFQIYEVKGFSLKVFLIFRDFCGKSNT